MPVVSAPQDPNWDGNIYVLATTRAFALMGTAYLVRSLYNLLSQTWGSGPASVVAAAVNDLSLEELNLDTLPTELVPPATDPNLDPNPNLEANLAYTVRLPQRTYNPHGHVQRSQASPRAYAQPVWSSETSVTANASPEQDVGVRDNGGQVEESSEVSGGIIE